MNKKYVSNVEDVTNALLVLSNCCISPKKLQKLLYISYAMYLVIYNEHFDEKNNVRLFKAKFEAWAHGPVIPEVYRKFKEFGMQPIKKNVDSVNVDEDTLNFLQMIIQYFGGYPAYKLEALTHLQDPWINARKGVDSLGICTNNISDEDTFNWYLRYVEKN